MRIAVAWFCLCLTAHAQNIWVKAPSEKQLQETPGLKHFVFESRFMKTNVGYNVVLPAGYEDGKERRYPVVYWLHGGGGNESSTLFTAKAWIDLTKAGEIDPVILVYPNGFRSGCMDHADGKVMVESMIIRELIPRIDREFRTIAEGRGRAIDLATTQDPFVVNILKRNCGDTDIWLTSAVKWQGDLLAKHIPCELITVPATAHNLRAVFKAEGKSSARFQDQVFKAHSNRDVRR